MAKVSYASQNTHFQEFMANNIVVILDNGHGQDTAGKCSPDRRLYEWSWCREIVARIYQQLMSIGIQTVILVPETQDISLQERVKREKSITKQAKQANKSTILISVHINAAGNDGKWKSARGFSGWVAQNASENSKKLAKLLYSECEKRQLQGNRSVPTDKYWTANFYILKNTSCPAVLTENLFQDNKQDVDYLLSEQGKQAIVDLHVAAIEKYIQ